MKQKSVPIGYRKFRVSDLCLFCVASIALGCVELKPVKKEKPDNQIVCQTLL